jgi:hypothetical protein
VCVAGGPLTVERLMQAAEQELREVGQALPDRSLLLGKVSEAWHCTAVVWVEPDGCQT